MKNFKRITALALILFMFLASLASCVDEDKNKNDTTVADTTEQTVTDSKTVIVSDGTTQYKIIRKADAYPDEQFLDAYLLVKNSICEKGNCTITLGVDFKRSTDTYDLETYEILVGNTGYDETKTVMNSIDYYQFAIKKVGNKIVIAAHTEELIIAACEYFSENLLKVETNSENKSEVVYMGDYVSEITQTAFFSDENKLSDYVIIYPSSNENKEDAERLSTFLSTKYGIELAVKSDATAAVQKEILIGITNRTESTKYTGQNTNANNIMQFVKIEGVKIVLTGKIKSSTECAVTTFMGMLGNLNYSFMCNIPTDTNVESAAFPATDTNELAEGANLRIMSYNILSEEWNDKTPITDRQYYIAATILYYSPDVIGLQEVSTKWYGALPDLISSDYTMVCTKTSKGEYNYTGMAYNKNKVKLLESGTDIFDAGNSTRLRLVTWGYYEKLDTHEKFFVMNTHWCIYQENRILESSEMAALYNTYKAKYNCPVITTGDYNANESSTEYLNYKNLTGLLNARVNATVKNRLVKTYHTIGEATTSNYAASIDQIFYTNDLTCLYYNTLIDEIVLESSDHCPIYADFKLD